MREPTPRNSRLAIAAGLLAMLAGGALGFQLGLTAQPEPVPETNQAQPAPAPPETQSEEVRILERADLVALAADAADAAASGAPVPRAVAESAGRRFDLLLPFGCRGPAAAESAAPLRWSYDDAEEVLRVQARPTSWPAADWNVGIEAGIESVEGFWIARPWSSAGSCPPPGADQAAVIGSEPVTLPGQTLALAQFLAGDARREARRGARPFELVRRVPRTEFDASRGFRLRLLGRIGRVPGGAPVRCLQPGGIEQRPICVIAVTLAEARLENAANGVVLATWPIVARPN